MSKTTKEQRATYRSLFAESQSPLAFFVKHIIDDLEAAEAEVQRLQGVLRQLMATGLAVEALLADEPSSVYIHPGIWAKLKEHRGHLRRGLLMLRQERESE